MYSQYHIGNGVLRDGDDEEGGFMGKNGPHSQYLTPLQNTGIFHMHGLIAQGLDTPPSASASFVL